jgi:thioredoxin reductase
VAVVLQFVANTLMSDSLWDVVILGAGPAGLSAALLLGRCRRRVLVCDTGTPRNARSPGVHGYLTRDGIDPWALRDAGRRELEPYDVEFCQAGGVDARLTGDVFEVDLSSGERVRARRLLLATGVRDEIPPHPGFADCFGRTVHHCPYCDGWEARGQRLAVYARGRKGVGLALALLDWSHDVLLCTDGPARLEPADRRRLSTCGVRVRQEPVARLVHHDRVLERIVFAGGADEPRDRVFLNTGQAAQSDLARRLGCRFNSKGTVVTDRREQSCVPGLYVAGDASRDVQLAIVAAAEGAKAAFAINSSFQKERFDRAG